MGVCSVEENCVGMVPNFFYPLGYTPKLYRNIPRKKMNNSFETLGEGVATGGIDPITGFTRRVMVKYPQFDYTSPYGKEGYKIYPIKGPSGKLNSSSVPLIESFYDREKDEKCNSCYLPVIILFSILLVFLLVYILLIYN
jgi:hypothetical protein